MPASDNKVSAEPTPSVFAGAVGGGLGGLDLPGYAFGHYGFFDSNKMTWVCDMLRL